MKPRILVCCDYYLPGIRGGGGMWTVVNLVNRFSKDFDFFVVTRDHDGPNDRTPYSNVDSQKWNQIGSSSAFYLPPAKITPRTMARLFDEVTPDLVFLNSVFSKPSVMFLAARRLGRVGGISVVISPCGEFGEGAFRNRSLKKRVFLAVASIVGLHKELTWKATSELEVSEIRAKIGSAKRIEIAPDLPPETILPNFDISSKPEKIAGSAKLVFVSRIVRKKNLKFLLRALQSIDDGEIELEIIGPPEDEDYWRECSQVIETLPKNIRVNAPGGLDYETVLAKMCEAHYFVLPTLNENFGYVFLEAMAAGCPILISDRTMWNEVETKRAGWVESLNDAEKWTLKLRKMVEMGQDEYEKMSGSARRLALDWLSDPGVEEATAKVLWGALGEKRGNTDQ